MGAGNGSAALGLARRERREPPRGLAPSVCPGDSSEMPAQQPQTNPFRAPVAKVERGAASGAYPQVSDPFARDRFLLRQQHLAIHEKYDVWDDQGNQVLFIERPSNVTSILFAALAAGLVFLMCCGGFAAVGTTMGESLYGGFAIVGFLLGASAAFITAVALIRKRDVTIYRDQDKTEALLHIRQDQKFMLMRASFTVVDASGVALAQLRKNYLWNMIRRRWLVVDAAGRLQFRVLEDSIILSLLRRLLGSLFGLLRTNFIILAVDGRMLGRFNRTFTLLDRYVLDLTTDPDRVLDRRLALAIGVMLDTGERR